MLPMSWCFVSFVIDGIHPALCTSRDHHNPDAIAADGLTEHSDCDCALRVAADSYSVGDLLWIYECP